ncbi:MAG: hypothetical protein KGZ63_09175 [Clostridiales bacterium]|jgi:hypothetical protein|nr:hypothetical protein [Clostridiales bacterium]
MRKIFSLMLIFLMLVASMVPVLGSGYRESALVYLTEKYGVPEERIALHEGGTIDLEFTAESFWFAKYDIVLEGKKAPGFPGEEAPRILPAPEPMPLPAPDMPADTGATRPAILPIPPRDIMDDGYLYGGVYIRLKTGEILELDQMDKYYEAERSLAQQEWERLQREAGKLDVSLYQKLQGLSASEIISVWIRPMPLETETLRAEFAALQKKYPELSKGMTLPGILSDTYGYALPDPGESSTSSGNGVSDKMIMEPAVKAEVSDEKLVGSSPMDRPDTDMPDEEYRQEFQVFWEELEQIRLLSVASSLAEIRAFLEGMGVSYRDNVTSISADLSVEQIRDIAELSSVASVFEEYYTTMEDAIMFRGSAPNEKTVALAEAAEVENKRIYLPVILLFTAVLALFMWLYYPKFRNKIQQ